LREAKNQVRRLSQPPLVPVTDEVIRWHLSGQDDRGRDFVMGVYPMLQDETCHFLAVDFDRKNWQEDAGGFLKHADNSVCRSFWSGRVPATAATVDDRIAAYGHLVVDECHHLSARSFELVARRAKAKFVTGLSATVTRKDGHHPIIFMQCGPVRYRVDAKQQAATRPFTHQVFVHPTGFRSLNRPSRISEASFIGCMKR